jgi:ABC-type dipeptide/oligopeptide/nickel transport system permease subunit
MTRFLRRKPAVAAATLLAAIVLLAVFAPWLTTGNPTAGGILRRLRPIGTPGHWLGTDELGRDMWTRLAYGGPLSLLSGTVPVFGALLIGGGLGVLAGYRGGWVNLLVMRTMDVFYAFPSVLLAIGVGAVIGGGFSTPSSPSPSSSSPRSSASPKASPPASAPWTMSRPRAPAAHPRWASSASRSSETSSALSWSTPQASQAWRSSSPPA